MEIELRLKLIDPFYVIYKYKLIIIYEEHIIILKKLIKLLTYFLSTINYHNLSSNAAMPKNKSKYHVIWHGTVTGTEISLGILLENTSCYKFLERI